MSDRLLRIACVLAGWIGGGLYTAPLSAATLKATFANGELTAIANPLQLTPVPLGSVLVETVSSLGPRADSVALSGLVSRSAYRYGTGTGLPASAQTGFELNTSGLITGADYSLELVVKFDTSTNFVRVLDASNRSSDQGLYVRSGDITPGDGIVDNNLILFQTGGNLEDIKASTRISRGSFHHVVVTVKSTPTPTVTTFVNGIQAFSGASSVLNIPTNGKLVFFLDNNVGGTQTEYAGGVLGMLQVYEGALSASDVTAKYTQSGGVFSGIPLSSSSSSAIPEPSTIGLMSMASVGLAGYLWRRRRKPVPPESDGR